MQKMLTHVHGCEKQPPGFTHVRLFRRHCKLCAVCALQGAECVLLLFVCVSMQPLYGAHWALFVPWVLFIFVYDEGRKFFVRRMSPDNVRRKALYW